MSGQARKMKREQMKQHYRRFVRTWNDEKHYRDHLGKHGAQAADGSPPMGKKPTFRMWLHAFKEYEQRLDATNDKSVEVIDPEWD